MPARRNASRTAAASPTARRGGPRRIRRRAPPASPRKRRRASAKRRGSSGIVGVTNIGSGARETWIFLPSEPPSCLVVFLHAAGASTPSRYLAWLDYLALGMECAVIFPRYHLSAGTAPTDLDG